MLRQKDVESQLIALGPQPDAIEGFAAHGMAHGRVEALLGVLEGSDAQNVFVHFSGYGYARWGLCWWLVDGLRRWRLAQANRRLVTLFHELYATGPVWRASFWTSPPQRRNVRRLASVCDAAITTSPVTAAKLRAWRPGLSVTVSPVFSNVGELVAPARLANRAPVAVVFGQAQKRRRLYAALANSGPEIADGFRRVGVERILDIGPMIDTPPTMACLPVEALGSLSAEEVSRHLANARIGLADYPLHVVTKSGILAAYFAHGLLAVNASGVGELPEDLREGREFVHPRSLVDPGLDPEAVAQAGFAWYRGHGRAETAALAHRLLS